MLLRGLVKGMSAQILPGACSETLCRICSCMDAKRSEPAVPNHCCHGTHISSLQLAVLSRSAGESLHLFYMQGKLAAWHAATCKRETRASTTPLCWPQRPLALLFPLLCRLSSTTVLCHPVEVKEELIEAFMRQCRTQRHL